MSRQATAAAGPGGLEERLEARADGGVVGSGISAGLFPETLAGSSVEASGAVGSSAEWVERAKRDTVRGLRAAARGNAAPEEEDAKKWHRIVVELDGEDRKVVDRALELAG